MDKNKYIEQILVNICDYNKKNITLGTLVSRIEGIIEIIDEEEFKDGVFDDFVALEEVYARTVNGDFDFRKNGEVVVKTALSNIMEKCTFYTNKRRM